MAGEDDWPPAKILALGAAIALGIVALGYLLKIVLPVLGVAIGLCFATATTGLATAGAVAPWVAPAAAGSVAVTGLALTLRLTVTAARAAQDNPYEWSLPLLGFAAGFLLNLWKDLGGSIPTLRWGVGGGVAFLTVVAGACYKRRNWQWKAVAVLLYLVPPLTLLVWDIRLHGIAHEGSYFAAVSLTAWLAIGGLGAIGLIIATIERATRSS
jgi:hypothetical protein